MNLALDRDAIARALGSDFSEVGVRVYRETSSTNDRAREYLSRRPVSPQIIAAESQSAGRGRHGRRWQSPPFVNLLFSLAIPSGFTKTASPLVMNLATAAFVCRSIKAISREMGTPLKKRVTIKWPNDVELDGRKIAGILTETVATQGWIVGIGLNVNLSADQIPDDLTERAGSLKIATGRDWPREQLAGDIAYRLLTWMRKPEPERSESAARDWQKRCAMIGKNVRVRTGGKNIEGEVTEIALDGALVIRDAAGLSHRITHGEIEMSQSAGA